jgi:hypothetical protein
MRTFIILALLGFFALYGLANAVLALKDPDRWLRASWTATRGFDPGAIPPPTRSDVRATGCFFLFFGCAAIGLAIRFLFN